MNYIHELSIKSIFEKVKTIVMKGWKELLMLAYIPYLFTLFAKYIVPSSLAGNIFNLLSIILSFVSYILIVMWTIYISKHSIYLSLPQLIKKLNPTIFLRVCSAHVWMSIVIIWPSLVLVALSGLLGYAIGDNSFSGTTIALIALAVSSGIGAIVAFIRSLSYAGISYLSIRDTNHKVHELHRISKSMLRTVRLKLLKIILIQIVLTVAASFFLVLMPLVQVLFFVAITVFMCIRDSLPTRQEVEV